MVRAKGSSCSDGKGPRGAGTPLRTRLKQNRREANERPPNLSGESGPDLAGGPLPRRPATSQRQPPTQPCPAQGDLSLHTLTCFVTRGNLSSLGNLFAGL